MNYKKIIVFSAIAGITTLNYGQKLETTNAAVAYKPLKSNPMWIQSDKKNGEAKLLEAKKEIDKAFEKYSTSNTLKPKDEAKLLFYRGFIYLDYILVSSLDENKVGELEENEELYEEASLGSLKKAIKLDTRKTYTPEIEAKMKMLGGMSLQGGVAMFNEGKYKEAFDAFVTAEKMSDVLGKSDTLSIYNAALSAERLDDYENAIKYFKKSADAGYKTGESYQSIVSNLIKKNGGPSEEAYKYILEGRKKYPNNLSLIISEFNYYITEGETEKAQSSLQEAIEKDPNNPIFHFNIGATFDELTLKKHKEKEHEEAAIFSKKAIEVYKKAIEIKPDFADAFYNLGVFYYNESIELNSIASELGDKEKEEKTLNLAKEYMSDAIPYLEEAHKLQPKDVNTLKVLKSIYFNQEKEEQYNIVDKKLKELGQ